MVGDPLVMVVAAIPNCPFDVILALALLQREPHRIADQGIVDLSRTYPFECFDQSIASLPAACW